MNIKTIANSILPVEPKSKVEGGVKTKQSTERDANGRQEQAQEEPPRRLSQQEFDDALAALNEFAGLKANQLEIKVETHGDQRIVLIVDASGKVVRRLSEGQLWQVTRDKDRQTGRLLDKAM